MRAPFLSIGGNKMFKMLYDSNFTYDSSMPVYENRPPSWPYTLDYKIFHDCMIPPCPTRSYPGTLFAYIIILSVYDMLFFGKISHISWYQLASFKVWVFFLFLTTKLNKSYFQFRCVASTYGNVAGFEWWQMLDGWCLLQSTWFRRSRENVDEELWQALRHQQVKWEEIYQRKKLFRINSSFFSSRAPFGLFYHAAWFTQPHHKEGFIKFLDIINGMNDVWLLTNWQALQWVRDPTPISRINSFQPFQCDYSVIKLHKCSDTTRLECVKMGNGRFLSKKLHVWTPLSNDFDRASSGIVFL